MEQQRKRLRVASAVVIILIPAVATGIAVYLFARAREASRRARCMQNLMQIGLALGQYAEEHDGDFPKLVDVTGNEVPAVDDGGTINTREPARSAFAVLLDRAYLDISAPEVFICPSSGDTAPDDTFPRESGGCDVRDFILDENQCSYGWDPAKRWTAHATCALVADKPPGDVSQENAGTAKNNSDNHRKKGQNVCFKDGSVRWTKTPANDDCGDPDIYLGGPGYEQSITDAKIIR